MTFANGTLIKNRYHVIGRLGKGGFGTVYKVTDVVDEKAKALKEVKGYDPDLSEIRNLEALAAIPGVQKMHTHFLHKTSLCIILEIYSIDLGSLFDNQHFTKNQIMKIGYQLTKILKDVHGAGYLHRDLKSENIMLKAVGNEAFLHIVDFGMAKCFMTPDGNIIPVPMKDYNFAMSDYSSLSLALGNRANETDDLVMMLYMLMDFAKVAPFGGKTHVQKTAMKIFFHSNPGQVLRNDSSFLLGVAYVIINQANANNVDYDEILKSFQNTAKPVDLNKPFCLKYARGKKITLV
ncbi:hypothetical protein B9Z55_027524 [Caenorhabditis nigoni]|uniref:non-specific serine/threonine protein kinase n=1 Tax=Caenorhabditis nigoni TaxID=1611254 RepID=A0A2G5SC81_9PELO|nr:hypothetical protein B9Z55_028203 [Caenorhabditis nigoni]PIC13645.1 hypothetical protein B9Z55_027524 [Caenorhabditis nigoni]